MNLKYWLQRSSWALLDQGLFAASNFILNVILARWLGAEGYGAFAISYTVFLFVGVIHTSLITEPMLVFGSGRYQHQSAGYVACLLKIHWSFAWVGCACITAFAGLAYWSTASRGPIFLLAALSGLLLYPWLLRRASYLPTRPKFAAEGGAFYLLMLLGIVFALRHFGMLSALTGLMAMGAASLMAGALIQWRLTHSGELDTEIPPTRGEILCEHWNYGRWALFTSILGWIPGNLSMLILPIWGGTEASGQLKAASNLILPVQQLLAAAGPLILPMLVRTRTDPNFRIRVHWMAAGFALPTLLWTLLLVMIGTPLSQWLYQGGFPISRPLLIFLGLQTTLSAALLIFTAALRALELPKLTSYGYAISCLLSLLIGVPLTAIYGVEGAAAGCLIAVAANGLVMASIFRNTFKDR